MMAMNAPSSQQVRSIVCPKCKAEIGFGCLESDGKQRPKNHLERVQSWKSMKPRGTFPEKIR